MTARLVGTVGASVLLILLAGCKSYWIDATVQNQTGAEIRELEVDYPTASFGINSVSNGSVMRYRFQVRGRGPVKVEYQTMTGKTVHLLGLDLTEREEGQITIRLLPEGKAEFTPNFRSVSNQATP